MNLQDILYGAFVPPKPTSVRRHKVDISDGQRYEPPKPKTNSTRDASGLTQAERLVNAAIHTFNDYASAADISSKVKMTRNYCQIILASLYKRGLVTRYKTQRNGTRLYMYLAKDDKNAG